MQDRIYIKSNPKIVFRQEEDEALIFDPDTGSIKVINSTGILIWKLLDGVHAEVDIIKMLKDRFQKISVNKIKKDVDEFLKDLKELKLVDIKK